MGALPGTRFFARSTGQSASFVAGAVHTAVFTPDRYRTGKRLISCIQIFLQAFMVYTHSLG